MSAITQRRGFTIVELLIVIVVIAILAAISIVAYNGVQTRAQNTARVNEARQWQQLFMAYAAQNGQYPTAISPGQNACLGTGFPDNNNNGSGNCWDVHISGHVSVNSQLNTQLATISSLPSGDRTPVPGATAGTIRLGPALHVTTGGQYRIIYWITGSGCPIGVSNWSDSLSQACRIELPAA